MKASRFLVAEQARELDVKLDGIVLEPEARNRRSRRRSRRDRLPAPWPRRADPDPAIRSRDLIDDTYRACVASAADAARSGKIVTFGITPTEPATGYGYIEIGPEIGNGVHEVSRFVEKPNADVAQQMLDSGNFAWNSGMFVFSAGRMIEELKHAGRAGSRRKNPSKRPRVTSISPASMPRPLPKRRASPSITP